MTPDELHRYLSGTAHQRVFDHPLLYQLMTYGDGAKAPYRITNWNAYGLVARGLLTWLAQRTFNQHRLPWHPDTCFTEIPDKDHEELEQLRKLLADWSAELSGSGMLQVFNTDWRSDGFFLKQILSGIFITMIPAMMLLQANG